MLRLPESSCLGFNFRFACCSHNQLPWWLVHESHLWLLYATNHPDTLPAFDMWPRMISKAEKPPGLLCGAEFDSPPRSYDSLWMISLILLFRRFRKTFVDMADCYPFSSFSALACISQTRSGRGIGIISNYQKFIELYCHASKFRRAERVQEP